MVQPVLPKCITSLIRMVRRKTWPERGRKRGRKSWPKGVVLRRACRNRGREISCSLWFAARSFGVQLHDDDPACKRGCARRQLLCVGRCAQRNAMSVHFFVIAGNFWYESVLVDNGNAFFAVSCKLSCRSCMLVWYDGLGPCHCWHPKRDLAKCVDTHGSLQRHTLGDAVQSGFRGFHTGSRLNRCGRDEQHGCPPRFYDDPSLAGVPYQCQESRSPVHQQLPQSRL